jgi:PD-(D/E)XK nuclease superfamily
MLAFLLDPSKAHCLNAEVFKGLVLKNFDSIICPPYASPVRPTRLLLDGLGDLYIDCEWKHIDVLAYSESLNLVVAIENKIDAKESNKDGTTQLQRYANILESDTKFSGYSKLFLFLTVDGEEPSDSNARRCS